MVRLLLLSGLLIFATTLQAQQFPVKVDVFLHGPFSPALSDLAYSNSDVQISIFLADLERSNYKAKLVMILEGPGITIRARDNSQAQAFYLNGGETTLLSGSDISEYLTSSNTFIAGTAKSGYTRTRMLPEGHYTLTVEIVDFNRGVKVSNTSKSMMWITMHDPPLINLPMNNQKVPATDPQNIIFSWSALHGSLPGDVLPTTYELTIVEVFPHDASPEVVVRNSAHVAIITTTETSYLYGIGDPPLIPGNSYAFRVRAIDPGGRSLFRNYGYSQVSTFRFGDACKVPDRIRAEALSDTRVKIHWDVLENHTSFNIQFAEAGAPRWESLSVSRQSTVIPGLRPGVKYVSQVQAVCATLMADYSQIVEIQLPQSSESFACGVLPKTLERLQTPHSEILKVGDVIKASDFEIILTEITQNTGHTYAGKGYAFLPWMNETAVAVHFKRIKINQDKQVYDGNVNTVYTAFSKNAWKVDLSSDDDEDPGSEGADMGIDSIPLIRFDGIIDTVYIDETTKTLVIIDDQGISHFNPIPELSAQESILVEDAQGTEWLIEGDRPAKRVTGELVSPATATAASIDYVVQFFTSMSDHFGFDDGSPPSVPTVIDLKGESYKISWRSVSTSSSDRLMASAVGRQSFPTEVYFELRGRQLETLSHDDGKEVFLPVSSEEADTLLALANTDSGTVRVGQLNVARYVPLQQRVVLVPVNNSSFPRTADIEKRLNEIYEQAVVDWKVELAGNFVIDDEYVKDLDYDPSDLFSGFNEKMKRFNRAYQWDHDLQGDAYYIFLIPRTGSSRSGFMPFKRRFGYLFAENITDVGLVIAHELGHGAFGLEHTFEQFSIARGTTDNLMDYRGGTSLAKYQWDAIHDPMVITGWLTESDESSFEEYQSAFTDVAGDNVAGCWSEGFEHGRSLREKYEMRLAIYGGLIRMLLCETENENCGSGGSTDFACGLANGFLQEVDWMTVQEAVDNASFNPVPLLHCVARSVTITNGEKIQYEDLCQRLFKCISGVEISDLAQQVGEFVAENWEDQYYQGQATAFLLTLFSPFKGKVLEKLRTLPRYADKIEKLEKLTAARNADELVALTKTMVAKGRTLLLRPSWMPNRVITGNLENPKGLIGVYSRKLPDGTIVDDTKRALAELEYETTYLSNFTTYSKDGFKMLNTSEWYYRADQPAFWDDFNKPWLDELVKSKADVVVMSDKNNDLLKFVLTPDGRPKLVDGLPVMSGFGKEIEYFEDLVKLGVYVWDQATGAYRYVRN
jgi:hypothetical protein